MSQENDKKKNSSKKISILVISIVVVAIIGTLSIKTILPSKDKVEYITTSSLEKIVDISELNTFQAVYNGIATVMNEKKTDEVDFYVSYEAKVSAGFDFDELVIVKDNEMKKITVTIPTIEIKDVNVDIASLDFMFQNEKADKSSVSDIALDACIEDVTEESSQEDEIYELAQQNAENIIEALLKPFIEQFNSEYTLEINQEGI